MNYRCIAPPVHNDPQLTTLLERCAVEWSTRWAAQVPVEQPSLGAEDFAELLRDVPGMMVRLGGGTGPKGVRRCTTERSHWRKTPSVLALRFSRPPCWRGSRRTPRHEPTSCGDLGFRETCRADGSTAGSCSHWTNQRQGKDRVQVLPAVLGGFGSDHHQQRSRSAAPPRQAVGSDPPGASGATCLSVIETSTPGQSLADMRAS